MLSSPRATRNRYSNLSSPYTAYQDMQFSASSCTVLNWSNLTVYLAFDTVHPASSMLTQFDCIVLPWSAVSMPTPPGGAQRYTLYAVGLNKASTANQVILVDWSQIDEPMGFWQLPQPNAQRPVQATSGAAVFYASAQTTVPNTSIYTQLDTSMIHPPNQTLGVGLQNLSSVPMRYRVSCSAASLGPTVPTSGFTDSGSGDIYLPAGGTLMMDVWLDPTWSAWAVNPSTNTGSGLAGLLAWGY